MKENETQRPLKKPTVLLGRSSASLSASIQKARDRPLPRPPRRAVDTSTHGKPSPITPQEYLQYLLSR